MLMRNELIIEFSSLCNFGFLQPIVFRYLELRTDASSRYRMNLRYLLINLVLLIANVLFYIFLPVFVYKQSTVHNHIFHHFHAVALALGDSSQGTCLRD